MLLPVLLGMAVRRRMPQRAARLQASVPSAVYGLLMYLSAAVLVVVGRRAVASGRTAVGR